MFSTATDCTGPFDWSASKQDWPSRIPIGVTPKVFAGAFFATISDCAVFQLTAALPSFVVYDSLSKQLTITVSSSTPSGTYSVDITAYLNDRVTAPKQESKQLTFEVFKATELLLASPQQANLELQSQAITIEMLPYVRWTPADAETNLSFALSGNPAFVSVSGSQLVISSAAAAGDYNFQVSCTDSVSGLVKQTTITLTLFNCQPSGLSFSPNSSSISILGPSQSVTVAYPTLHSACGTYTLDFDPQFTWLVSKTGQTLTISAPKGTATQANSVLFTLKRDANSTQLVQAALPITVTPCVVTSLSFTGAPTSSLLNVGIDAQPQAIAFLTTQSPLCDN